jgi:ABC-type amino acid transport system permease subunit
MGYGAEAAIGTCCRAQRLTARSPQPGIGPIVVQYLDWSTLNGQPMAELIRERLPVTLELWFIALIVTVALGAIFGIVRTRLGAPLSCAVLAVVLLVVRSIPVFLLWQGFAQSETVIGLTRALVSDALDS